jgi:phosphatidylethanolamine/phosphatidyl-N-methylethanolamine N-methyltransferase
LPECFAVTRKTFVGESSNKSDELMTNTRRLALPQGDIATSAEPDAAANPWMFFRRWIANPLQMGSVVPSSPALCRRVVRQVRREADEAVIELGAGTGVISRALLDAGIPPERLFLVEIVPDMVAHLRRVLPGVNIVEGDARALPELIPRHWHGHIGTVVCGIPLVLLPLAEQGRFIDAIEAVAPGRGFLHYSYCATSPLPSRKHTLRARREAWTLLNFPPASVWRYSPAAAAI